jgi:hypothetical protein
MIVFWNVGYGYRLTIKTKKLIVRRVHWLRARAQYMRWQEEATLISYEMQWTVRFFVNQGSKWAEAYSTLADPCRTLAGASGTLSEGGRNNAGFIAYCKRKHSTWRHLAVKSDRTFSLINSAYKSPL